LVLTSSLFSIIHFQLNLFPKYFLTGIVLNLSYILTKSLYTPIILHIKVTIYTNYFTYAN
jgi:membrane protease YdiL (CAAX protease family)